MPDKAYTRKQKKILRNFLCHIEGLSGKKYDHEWDLGAGL